MSVTTFLDAKQRLLYQLNHAEVRTEPFPHFYIEDVFPSNFYQAMRNNFPNNNELISISKTGRTTEGYYKERFILNYDREHIEKLSYGRRHFWHSCYEWLGSQELLLAMGNKFKPFLDQHPLLKDGREIVVDPRMLLVNDTSNYQIGPHTDIPRRFFSAFFYLPEDCSQSDLGTSLYVPAESGRTCDGYKHHERDGFYQCFTAKYQPNSFFAFMKTNNSFHGVEPIWTPEVERRSLLYVANLAEA